MTMTTTWITPLASVLTTAGVTSADADVLAQQYANADPQEFAEGLRWMAQAYTDLKMPPQPPPDCEPWDTICAAVAAAQPGDIDEAFRIAIANEPPDVQSALFMALIAHAQWLSAQQTTQPARKKRILSAEYIQTLANLGYQFRMNTLNDMVEVCQSGVWETLSDPIAKLIRRQMRDAGYDFVNVMEDAYGAEAYLHRYHPIRDYLDSLQYDGGDYIAKLASYFQDVDGVFGAFLRRWLIGAVARVRRAEQNRMLVLDGKQNLGKSFLVKWLATAVPQYYIEGPISVEDKDNYIRLASKWLWEVSEFGNTIRRSDRDALKFFLTMHTVTVRKAYGEFDMIKPALASWIGTFNNETGVLNDPTGNRRFMVVQLLSINWNYSRDMDPNQVWAEANAAFLAGEQWTLNEDEVRAANRVNERYEIDDPLDGILKRLYRLDPTATHIWTPTDEIITTLEANGLRGGSTRQNAMALASVLTKAGIARAKRLNKQNQRVWGYIGVELI